jgi:hypothetical protein
LKGWDRTAAIPDLDRGAAKHIDPDRLASDTAHARVFLEVYMSAQNSPLRTLTPERIREIRDRTLKHKIVRTSYEEEIELCDLALEALASKQQPQS